MRVLLVVCLVAGLANARPHTGDEDEDSMEDSMKDSMEESMEDSRERAKRSVGSSEEKMGGIDLAHRLASLCAFELNSKPVHAVECMRCFHELKDPMSPKELPKTKACLTKELKDMSQECSAELSALDGEDEQSEEALLDCLEGHCNAVAGRRCLEMSKSTNSIEILTDGLSCLMETQRNVTFLHSVLMAPKAGTTKGMREMKDLHEPKENPMVNAHYVNKKMAPEALCFSANHGNANKARACSECIYNIEGDFIAEAIKCSKNFLLPYFNSCHEKLSALSPERNIRDEVLAVKNCYIRGIYKHIVSYCNEGKMPTEVTLEDLESTMKCGHKHAIEWVEHKVEQGTREIVEELMSLEDEEEEREEKEEEEALEREEKEEEEEKNEEEEEEALKRKEKKKEKKEKEEKKDKKKKEKKEG